MKAQHELEGRTKFCGILTLDDCFNGSSRQMRRLFRRIQQLGGDIQVFLPTVSIAIVNLEAGSLELIRALHGVTGIHLMPLTDAADRRGVG